MKGEPIRDLKKIKVKDNGEPLVDVKKICPKIIIGLEPSRLKKEKSIFVRKRVAEMLKKAQKLLPDGYNFKIQDGWRPLKEQERYYFRDFRKLQKKNPNWPVSHLKKELNKWVFPPDAGIVPWHATGGAVDLTICYPNGRSLPMKSKKEKLPAKILKNRKLMKDIMGKVGFTNYSFEYWHFSYGDSGWALRTKRKTAIYGAAIKSG
jgi:D-alanyl-D-alanine dipeptidase